MTAIQATAERLAYQRAQRKRTEAEGREARCRHLAKIGKIDESELKLAIFATDLARRDCQTAYQVIR